MVLGLESRIYPGGTYGKTNEPASHERAVSGRAQIICCAEDGGWVDFHRNQGIGRYLRPMDYAPLFWLNRNCEKARRDRRRRLCRRGVRP
jgi:hypothetical protein